MTGDPKSMSCQEFQDQLSELIGSGADASAHPHLQSCELCRALLNDLETIAEAARQLFPIQQPEDDLWERIETAIKKDEDGVSPGEIPADGATKAD
jgi:predicted anti-sigma-YlaC factor YlaD